ncbi:MAG: hypothetical protein KGL43_25995 [Burkholderiales bacterium]|nr:hypothetical protein [Burkholderiales bacterium]
MQGPTKDEAPTVPAVAPQEQTQTNSADFATDKAFATMRAIAAGAGCGLYALAGGGFLLTRWGMAKELPSLGDVRSLLARMGVNL